MRPPPTIFIFLYSQFQHLFTLRFCDFGSWRQWNYNFWGEIGSNEKLRSAERKKSFSRKKLSNQCFSSISLGATKAKVQFYQQKHTTLKRCVSKICKWFVFQSWSRMDVCPTLSVNNEKTRRTFCFVGMM